MTAWAEMVAIGRIDRPQGRKGEVVVTPLSDVPDRFPTLERAFVPGPGGGGRALEVVARWPHKRRWVLEFEGVDSIDAAEALRGVELRIGPEDLAPLPADTYYHHDLRGLAVEDAGTGASLGVVRGLIETGGVPVLEVETASGESLIPLARRFVERVDVPGGRLLVRVPEYEDAEA